MLRPKLAIRSSRAVLLILSVLLLGAAASGTVERTYGGGYGGPGAFTVTSLVLTETAGVVSGKMRQPDERPDEPPLRNIKSSSDRLSFDADTLRFDLRRTPHGYAGQVRDARGARHPAAFVIRPGGVPPEILAAYEGSYGLGDGRILTLSRNNAGSGFWYLELPSGRTGFLFNLSNTEFTAGPCIYCAGPERLHVSFAPGADGPAPAVSLRLEGRPYAARRLTGYTEQEVAFTSRDGARLAGSLFLPTDPGPHPAVVFAHGSGAQSRNGYYGHIRFLAEAYARRGVAALAFDKRGVGKSQGDWEKAGFATLADDVAAGVGYLRTRPDIRPDRIGLTGGSQAGWIMPMAASRVPGLRFIQHFSAASPMGVREQERRRLVLQMQAETYPPAEIDRALKVRDLMDDYAVTGQGWEALEAAAKAVETERWMTQFIGGLPARDAPDWPWLREAMSYDTRPDFTRFAGAWHVLYGERDVIAPIREGRVMLEAAIAKGPSRDVTIEVVPGATHNFLLARTGSDKEFSGLTRFVPGFHDKVTAWAARRVR
ncbi:MAG TPA: CocE/NonD family hydrolase [Caulobacteraceae bacterium]|jgi:hypothetical protein